MALGAVPHRQDVVGEVGRLVPRRRERDVTADETFVLQDLYPREAVGVRPDRVVDAREVCIDLAAAVLQEVREQERQLVHCERVLARPRQLVPARRVRRRVDGLRHELVPRVREDAPLGRDRAEQGIDEEERARHLPPAAVARGGRAPVVTRKLRARGRDYPRDLFELPRVHARLLRRVLEGELGVKILEHVLEALEARLKLRVLDRHVLLPVPPAAHELAVVKLVLD